MPNKVKVPGGAFYVGDGLTVDQTTRTVSAGGGSSVSTPDWNQNDPNASDYIKNRPGAYETNTLSEIYNGTVVNNNTYMRTDADKALGSMLDTVGNQCNVVLDGVEYDNLIVTKEGINGYVGDPNLITYPFCLKHTFSVETSSDGFVFTSTGSRDQTLIVKTTVTTVVPIDSKYLPNRNVVDGNGTGVFTTNGGGNTFIGQPAQAVAIGSDNSVSASNSLCVGLHNQCVGAYIAAGEGLMASSASVFGNYNYPGGSHNKLLTVGNGTSDTARHNAFMVFADGKIVVPSSTSGSTKYFAITVDDAGTITATETSL